MHATGQVTLRIPPAEAAAITDRLRARPPAEIAGHPVAEVVDYSEPAGPLPPTDMLAFGLGGDRVIVRPSGTEPKLKIYIETVEPVSGDDLARSRDRAHRRLKTIAATFGELLRGLGATARAG